MGLLVLPIVDGRINGRGASLEQWRTGPLAQLAAAVGFAAPPLTEVADTPAIPARVNANRWIVDCPDCNGAEFVWTEGPLVMLCAGCWNAAVGHQWRPVLLPDPDARAAIEAILLARPMPATRNWEPWESIAELAGENMEHAAGRAG